MSNSLKRSLFLVLSGVMIFLTFNKHSKSGYFNYHSEIWADKAGYYVYLPATFKYQFDTSQFPDSIDVKTGNGFELRDDNKVITKYTYGVALMQMPFYLAGELYSGITGKRDNGFGRVSHAIINIAAVFYLMLGIYFLYGVLNSRLSASVTIITLFTIVLGTNLFYYSIDDTGMSHVYSFALFSGFLYVISVGDKQLFNLRQLILISFIAALIVFIRPLNAIFVAAVFLLKILSGEMNYRQVAKLSIYSLLCFIVVLIPQMLYWDYAHGELLVYSYGNEGFDFTNPRLLTTLFAPKNGLILYSPLFSLIIWSIVKRSFRESHKWISLVSIFTFLLITFLFSSWWTPDFGCSYGARSYVEYLVLFSIPFGYLTQEIWNKGGWQKWFFSILMFACVAFNMKLIYTYDQCFMGEGYWDWNEYLRLITGPTK